MSKNIKNFMFYGSLLILYFIYFKQFHRDLQSMFIAKVVALTQYYLNGLNRSERREMVSFEDTGLNIIQERCGMVSNSTVAILCRSYLAIKFTRKVKSRFNLQT